MLVWCAGRQAACRTRLLVTVACCLLILLGALQVDRLHAEKAGLQKEKTDLQRTVSELGSSIDKMHRDKVTMESQMEMEEEGIVNRLNRSAANFALLGGRLVALACTSSNI